jgi:hypothetical protein
MVTYPSMITGKHIQAKLKQALRSQWCVDKGVRLTVNNTQGEEFRCPLSAYMEVLEYVTRHVEQEMGDDIIGSHAYKRRKDEDRADVGLEVMRERTKQAEAESAHKRAEAESAHKRVEAENATTQANLATMRHLVDNGFTFEQIRALLVQP